MNRKDKKKLRKEELRVDELRFMHPKLGYWSRKWRLDEVLKAIYEKMHFKPKQDALVQRIVEHKQEVKNLRKR